MRTLILYTCLKGFDFVKNKKKNVLGKSTFFLFLYVISDSEMSVTYSATETVTQSIFEPDTLITNVRNKTKSNFNPTLNIVL